MTSPGEIDARHTSGIRLTPAFGIRAGRRVAHDVPAFGSPEHSALMTGSLDLTALEVVEDSGRAPLLGFAPIRLAPEGPGSPAGSGRAPRVSRARAVPRPGGNGEGFRFDPTPTGELARPFVTASGEGDWAGEQDVPPPVSVDVFQRAVRAGVDPGDTRGLERLAREGEPVRELKPNPSRTRPRSRRELRARERAQTSVRGVTARRIAKGGVLVITALGVVSSATTHGNLFAPGDDGSGRPTDFAKSVEANTTAPVLSAAQQENVRQARYRSNLGAEFAAQNEDDLYRAGADAGDAAQAMAGRQEAEELARREAARQEAIRGVVGNPRGYARNKIGDYGWGSAQFACLSSLWDRESHWNYRATNPGSGAYGIPQALPGSKMNSVGSDWRTNPVTQINWGLNYIQDRYGTPCGAWAHSEKFGWY